MIHITVILFLEGLHKTLRNNTNDGSQEKLSLEALQCIVMKDPLDYK